MQLQVTIPALPGFRAGLRRANLRAAARTADGRAARLVSMRAIARAGGVGRQAAKAAASMRVTSGLGGAVIESRLSWLAGAELGSLRYGQFKSWRGTAPADALAGGSGYFLFPSIRDAEKDILDTYEDEILRETTPAFPN